MDSPIEAYKNLRNIQGIKELATSTLFNKYVIENRKAEEKLWEWDSTDQESLMLAKNGGFPLPGSIYTFLYPPKEGKTNINNNGDVITYIDLVPIIFCTSIRDGLVSGINFNLLPEIERLSFLETYYTFYKKFFEDLESKTQNNILALNNKFISVASSSTGKLILDVFMQKAGSNFNFAYRKYNMRNINNIRMIEYCEWNYIPFYEPRSAFKGMNFKQLYDLYWKS